MRLSTELLIEQYQDQLFAAAFSICKNPADADDAVQDTFLQYHLSTKQFDSEPHIRAWLIRVVINKTKDSCRSLWRRKNLPLDEYMETLAFETPEAANLFEQVLLLPEKYRMVIHLHYYEDYSVREIAGILRLTEANVKVRLSRGRKLLKEILKEEWDNDKS